jgi:excisionase family DNA binding protein
VRSTAVGRWDVAARQHHLDVERLLTPAEVAELFKVNPLTVTRWANRGRIGSVRTFGGHTRYKEAEVLRLLNEATREAGPPSTDER